jgi:hypothetical protein
LGLQETKWCFEHPIYWTGDFTKKFFESSKILKSIIIFQN